MQKAFAEGGGVLGVILLLLALYYILHRRFKLAKARVEMEQGDSAPIVRGDGTPYGIKEPSEWSRDYDGSESLTETQGLSRQSSRSTLGPPTTEATNNLPPGRPSRTAPDRPMLSVANPSSEDDHSSSAQSNPRISGTSEGFSAASTEGLPPYEPVDRLAHTYTYVQI